MKINKLIFAIISVILLTSCRGREPSINISENSSGGSTDISDVSEETSESVSTSVEPPNPWTEISEAEFVEFANSKDYSDIQTYSLSLETQIIEELHMLRMTRTNIVKFDLDSNNAYYGYVDASAMDGIDFDPTALNKYIEIAKDSSGNYIEKVSSEQSSFEAIQSNALESCNTWSASNFYNNYQTVIEKYYVDNDGRYKAILPDYVEGLEMFLCFGTSYIFDSTGLVIDVEGEITIDISNSGFIFNYNTTTTATVNQPIDHTSIIPAE